MYFVLFLQQLIASGTHLFAKSVIFTLHPSVVVFYRACIAVVLYGLWLIFSKRKWRVIKRSDWPTFLLLGALNMPINQLLFIWGLRYTNPANAALAYALSPAFVLIITVLFFGNTLTRNKMIGIAVALVGTFIILFEKGLSFTSDAALGNVLELSASVSWAWYTVLSQRMAKTYGAILTTAVSMFAGFGLYVVLYSFLPADHVVPSSLTADQWRDLLYLGAVTLGIGYGLWNYLLTKLEASKVAVFNNLQPVMTTLLALLIFHQVPSPIFLVGGTIALVGVILTQRG